MPRDPSEPAIVDDPVARRYEARIGAQVAAFVTYRRQPERITFVHTEVRPGFEGQGIAGRLARHVLEDARASGRTVRPLCPYIAAFIESHPEYQDLVTP